MVAKTVGEILENNVALEVEQIDRLYLNGYIPTLQTPGMFATLSERSLENQSFLLRV